MLSGSRANADAHCQGEEIVYRDYVDLSVAVATPKGLVTPVVRNAETMGFIDIEKEIASLGKKVYNFIVETIPFVHVFPPT